jgi:hypothetical protein
MTMTAFVPFAPAPGPQGWRRPLWMLRPLKPDAAAYRLA